MATDPEAKTPRQTPTGMTAQHQHIEAQITDLALDIVQIINDNETRNFQLGVVFIVVAITAWILGLELVNSVLKGDDYQKPFLIAWISGSCFLLNLLGDLPFLYRWTVQKVRKEPELITNEPESTVSEVEPLLSNESSFEKLSQTAEELTGSEIFVLASQVGIIYFLYTSLQMAALEFTSASNQTVVSSTTSIFALFIGKFLGIDRITFKKLICILVSSAGVFLINWSESGKEGDASDGGSKFEPKNAPLGNLLAITGAFMYACYLVIMKVKVGTGSKTTNERRLFGYMGLFSFVFGIPVLVVVHYLDIEPFEFPPPNKTILYLVILNGIFAYISDYITILAMLLTSPVVTLLSLTLAIPITIFLDYIILRLTGGTKEPSEGGLNSDTFAYFLGISCILVSVLLINVNITTENEMINDYIEEALEGAIQENQTLSPVLSPLLLPKSPFAGSSGFRLPFATASGSDSIHRQATGVTFLTVLLLFLPRTAPTGVSRVIDKDLNNLELPGSQNPQIYTIDGIQEEPEEDEDGKLIVYGGENHRYKVKALR